MLGKCGAFALLYLLLLLLAACGAPESGTATPSPAATAAPAPTAVPGWNNAELSQMRRLWLGSLPARPADPSNAFALDPAAAELGQKLFFDGRLSANGAQSCAGCHRPEQAFSDGRVVAQGLALGRRNTPSLVGVAYRTWFYWDGRRDSLWAQALTPLETPAEQGSSRLEVAQHITAAYAADYEAIFGPLPPLADRTRFPERGGPLSDPAGQAAWESMSGADQIAVNTLFANVGKALAAYETTLLPTTSRFDTYVAAVLSGQPTGVIYSADEIAGLAIFLRDGRCTNCHSGPLLSDQFFHNVGVPGADPGREAGAPLVAADPFNCQGTYSDAAPGQCRALAELRVQTDVAGQRGAFRTPSLRNVAATAPYMHNGSLATLEDVIAHYNAAPRATYGRTQITPLGLTPVEQAQLVAFLRTLGGGE